MNSSTFTSLSLKLIGTIFILSSLLDYVTLGIPFNWQSAQWQINFVTSIVDRGIVPMVGMALILVGYWIDSNSGSPAKGPGLRLPVFILASVLGLLFLLLVPVHLNNLNQAKTAALEQIQQGAGQGEEQIKNRLAQINTLSQNPQLIDQELARLNQVIETGQVQGRQVNAQVLEQARQTRDQLQGLRDLAKNPQQFKQRLEELKNQWQTQLLDIRRNAENQAKSEALKQGLRVGLSSLMLAIGYSAIGWLGFRGLGSMKTSRSRV
ncbi:MAG: hypothetical protein IGR93_15535 [Hydrococcus sp. C42_A2020_068]|nr:hypothetical protein [Hydrococcus sp. C42_A2020_068]